MIKIDEIRKENSCLNRATATEMIFVLLARDAAAPNTILFWVQERLRLGKNKIYDVQIQDALRVAATMERQRNSPLREHDFKP